MNLVARYKELSVPKKASLWYLVSNILQKGISFFVVPFYVRILSASEYGHVMMFFSWYGILLIFVTLNLYCGVYTKAMVDYYQDRDRYTSCMQGLTTILTLLWFVLYLFFCDKWNELLETDNITSYLLFVCFLTSPSVTFWSVRQRVENKYRQMVYLTVAKSICTPLLCILLLLYTDLRSFAMIWGMLIIESVFGLYFYIAQFVKGKCFYHRFYWLHALKFNIPLIPHYLSLVILWQVDRILVGNICGKDKAGIYSLATQVSMIMSVVTSAINNALVPWLYEQYRVKNYNGVRKASNELCMLMGTITFIVMLITPEILHIIGTEEYMDAMWIVSPIVLGTYLSFCYGLFVNISFYYSKTKYVALATMVGAGLSVILNLVLLPKFGFISAGYTSLTCYFVFLLLHYGFMVKICHSELSGISFYDDRFIWLSCLTLFIIMFLSLILYNMSFVYRYVILLIILCIFMKKKEMLKSYIKL